ncbi:MAG: hypothetical protein OET90_07875 [Desulfuromonadales bacterium]|nr:hypothetical protein [Desulfuromonadales bacterium]
MNEYKLTFTVSIKDQDDPAARQQARKIAESICEIVPETQMKLQQVYEDKPPRGVRFP